MFRFVWQGPAKKNVRGDGRGSAPPGREGTGAAPPAPARGGAPGVGPAGQRCPSLRGPGVGMRHPRGVGGGGGGQGLPSAGLRSRGEGGPGRSAGLGAALAPLPALMPPLLPAGEAERLCVPVPAGRSAARPRGRFAGLRPRSRKGVVVGVGVCVGGVTFHPRGCKVRLAAAAAVSQRAAGSCTPSERSLSGSYWASSVD